MYRVKINFLTFQSDCKKHPEINVLTTTVLITCEETNTHTLSPLEDMPEGPSTSGQKKGLDKKQRCGIYKSFFYFFLITLGGQEEMSPVSFFLKGVRTMHL